MAFGLRRANKIYRWLKSRLSPGVIILGYHRISYTPSDLYNITVSSQNFIEQMEILKKHANIINITDLNGIFNKKTIPRNTVAITVDDGYLDVFNNALPILESNDIPATVFITTGFLGKEFWWDKLYRIFSNPELIPDDLKLFIADRTITVNFHNHEIYMDNSKHLFNSFYNILRYLPYIEIEKTLSSFTSQVKIKELSDDNRCMTEAELAELSKSDLIEIGSHSVSHPFLACLPVSEQRYEIEKSKSVLENIIKKSIECFSYPNGSISNNTMRLVQEAGYQLAFASEENKTFTTSNPLRLPRFWIPDWNGDKFYRWLKIWL